MTPLVSAELHRLAHRYMVGERPGHVLQTTALINEAYVRLMSWKKVSWLNRAHFFAVSAKLMRHILVDCARRRPRLERGGEARQVSLDEAWVVPGEASPDLVAIDDALETLATFDARKSQIVELRFFGGLSVEETAAVLKVSPITVTREWKKAKAWLVRELEGKELHEA